MKHRDDFSTFFAYLAASEREDILPVIVIAVRLPHGFVPFLACVSPDMHRVSSQFLLNDPSDL